MGNFIYFTDEQKERANAVPIADILQKEHEEVERSGNEWRWKRHSSVTFRGNSWYRHSQQVGGHAIDFMQEFFGMTYPEAVTYLLDGETGQVIHESTGSIQKSTVSKGIKQQFGQTHTTADIKVTQKEEPQISTTNKFLIQEDKNKTMSDTNLLCAGRAQVPVSDQEMIEKKHLCGEAEKERKILVPPEKNGNMKRVYAYLMQKRHISREILSFFARQGTLYESAGHHNAVFAGVDQDGNIRHIHKKGTCSDGRSFRMNEDGSDSCYGFGHAGNGNRLYVFEAPIDLLSFLTLYPRDWKENSYIALNGVAEHAMLQMLSDHPNLDTIILCLDHDSAGIEACGRLAEILMRNGYTKMQVLKPAFKDWNEELKNLNGEEAVPAKEHPKILECGAWISVLKEVARNMDMKYAAKEYICHYYQQIYNALKKGRAKENLEEAFDEAGMLLSGVLVRFMEKEGRELGKDTDALQILDNLQRRYRPHKDKGNYNTRIRNMQKAFAETMEVFDTKDLDRKENKELLVKKCMSLTMECIRAHIFVATVYEEPVMRQMQEERTEGYMKSQDMIQNGRGMGLCSR